MTDKLTLFIVAMLVIATALLIVFTVRISIRTQALEDQAEVFGEKLQAVIDKQ